MYFFFLLSRLLLLLLLSSVAASQSFLTSFRLSRLGNESPGLQMEGKDLCKRRRRLAPGFSILSQLQSSPTFNGSNWQRRCSVNFSWQMSRCGARMLMQLGLQDHHTSIIHLFLSFLPFLLSSTVVVLLDSSCRLYA